ncbi:acyltransferase [Thermaurantiacus tibetensis]|uniref:acyltransferase n=1 Tax=Thermaurantiacus tibetensis TaxID=2759035 RepID=UPI002E27F3E1|nr:DapH/DapD/GlmU-related protein [Thermaurantiacus tibetensis]
MQISRSAKLDLTNPRGIHIGDRTLVSFDAAILSHDFVGNRHLDTWIGANCFIGARVVIMPGVRVGDHSVIGAGSVVTRDIPAHSLAMGNPARVVREGIMTARWGIMDPRVLAREGLVLPGTAQPS